MANTSHNGGLRLYKAGIAPQHLELVMFAAADGTRVGIGDPVVVSSSGVSQIGQGPYTQIVTQSGSSGTIDGVIMCILPQFTDGSGAFSYAPYRPASTAMYALMRPAHNEDLWEIQASGSTIYSTPTTNGLNGDMVIGACSTVTGLSTCQWNSAAQDQTATRQLKFVGFVQSYNNDPTSSGADLIVRINNARYSGGTGTA